MKFINLIFTMLLFSGAFSFSEKNISDDQIIIDSEMTLSDALAGSKAPKNILDNLIILNVEYFSFDSKIHKGQLVIHKDLAKDVIYIFNLIKEKKFPIEKVIPIVHYGWSDNKSMEDNNTSAFNYRKVAGKDKLSNHSFGFAIDFNPFQNPAVYNDGSSSPKGSNYSKKASGTITSDNFITLELKKLGWTWGGDWTSLKDYQHFEKVLKK